MRTILIIVLCLAVLNSGCWGRREINELAFIDAIGIDTSPDGFLLTAQISNAAAEPQGAQPGARIAEPLVVAVSGRSVFEASRRLMEHLSRQPFFGNVRVVVLGEELARQGLIPALDYAGRDDELRRSVLLLVARGTTAHEILQTEHPIDGMPGVALDRMLWFRQLSASTPSIDLATLLRTLDAEGLEVVTSVVELVPPSDQKIIGVPIRVSGGAVFSRDRLIGYLDDNESRGLILVQGGMSRGFLVAQHEGGPVTFDVLRQRSRIVPRWDGHVPVIDIHINVEAAVMQQATDVSVLNPEGARQFADILSQGIDREIRGAIAAAQHRFNADIFGFGQAFFRRYPRQWRDQLQPEWSSIFPELEVRITVDATIRRSGMRTRPVPLELD